jgi:autotransporter adhesin
VTYADASKTDVTLGTAGTPVTMSNVAPGALSSTSTDTVNGSQLFATNQAIGDLTDALENGGVLDPSTGASLAVTYADASKTDVTLGTAGTPVTMTNVAPGALSSSSTDTVNGSQLFATNQAVGDLADALDSSGILDPATGESLAVTYADASKTNVTLGTAGTPVTMSNVAPGTLSSTSTDTVNGSQLFATNQAVSDLTDTLDNSGLIDPATGASLAVTYDDAAKDGVTLGGASAIAAVPLHNVATGTADTDGVNVAQLTTGLTDLKDELTNGAIDLKYIKVSSTGTQANANGTNAVSIGSAASSTAANAVAIGAQSRASGNSAVAIGYNSLANENNVVSVGYPGGERKIINVDDGDVSAGSTDAVNGGQLFAMRKVLDSLAGAIGKNGVNDVVDPLAAIEGVSGNNIGSLNGGDPNEATAAAIGVFSMASGANAIAVGLRNMAGSDYSVALGYMAQTGADHEYSVAVGSDVHTTAPRAVALGTRVQANAEQALALGSNETWAIGRSSIAIGDGVKVRAENSIAIGRNAMVPANARNALALGAEASVAAEAIGSVALGHGAVADRGNAISIGGGMVGTRQIIHVAAGTEPSDAVNVAQLQEAIAAMRAEIQSLRSQLGAR